MAEPQQAPRPVRAGPDEPVEVSLRVNGTPVTMRVPARFTLSDVLRDHLGLTGTHVGCEHGVCGMCTVLVDGNAARACLLFAVQLDGAEVTTVEALGTPDELHPLQQAFGRNHALQCGFCTPGFLMSSYDLLHSEPDVPAERLPAELSGVICRCTGYRNIVAAVQETQARYPDGIPEPGNVAERTLVGRAGAGSSVTDGEAEQTEAGPRPTEIVLPDGPPTAEVQVETSVGADPNAVWDVFDDVRLLARCLPGAELTDELGENTYAGKATISVGPVKLKFNGIATIVEHDRAGGRMRVLAQGQDTGGARTQAAIELYTEATGEGTALRADAKVYLTGRIAQFGRALAGDISRRMFEQFAASVGEAATSGQAPSQQVRPAGAVALMFGTVADRLRSLWQRRGAKLRRAARRRPTRRRR